MNKEYAISDSLINSYFDIITAVDGDPLALLVPEDAGRQTFPLIATALKQMEGHLYDVVVLVTSAPADQGFYQAQGKVTTPLGTMEVDQVTAKALGDKLPELAPVKINRNQQSDQIAESFPVLLSFLKHIAPYTKVLPILIPKKALDLASSFGKTLAKILSDKKAVVISKTDLDQTLLSTLEYNDPEIFTQAAVLLKHWQQEQPDLSEISAAAAAAALKYACLCGGNTVTILQEHLRHELNPAAVMLWDYQPPQLTSEQKEELHRLACQAIENYVIDGVLPEFESNDPALNRKAGVFITLRIKGMLRGCIGHLLAERPLGQTVQDMAIAAATSDPRFPPLTKEEIGQITTKIAILSPMKRISYHQVEVGTHGLLISFAGRRGVLLPEVASDRNWDKETFLEHLCLKAGLPKDTWRQNPRLYAFTSVVFGNE